MTVVRKRDSHEGDVKCIKTVCQLMEGYDGYGVVGRCDSSLEV